MTTTRIHWKQYNMKIQFKKSKKGSCNTLNCSHFVNVRPFCLFHSFSPPFSFLSSFLKSISLSLSSFFSSILPKTSSFFYQMFLTSLSFFSLLYSCKLLNLSFLTFSIFLYFLHSLKSAYSCCKFIIHSNSNPYKGKPGLHAEKGVFFLKWSLFSFL